MFEHPETMRQLVNDRMRSRRDDATRHRALRQRSVRRRLRSLFLVTSRA